jgi:hypothetical protein
MPPPGRARPIPHCHCIDRAKEPQTIVINEYTLFAEHCHFERPDLYFGSSAASGLGWGAGAALGAKLARPDTPVIAVLGDGAYMFSNPDAVHHASALHDLPVLFVVMNNGMWGAVAARSPCIPAGWRRNNDPAVQLHTLPASRRSAKRRAATASAWMIRRRSRGAGARHGGREEREAAGAAQCHLRARRSGVGAGIGGLQKPAPGVFQCAGGWTSFRSLEQFASAANPEPGAW